MEESIENTSLSTGGRQLEVNELASRKRSRRAMRFFQIFALVAFTLFVLVPIIYMITTSIKDPIEIRESGALFPTKGAFIINWINAYRGEPLFSFLLNSTVVAVFSSMLVLIIAVPTTYAIVRFGIGGKVS